MLENRLRSTMDRVKGLENCLKEAKEAAAKDKSRYYTVILQYTHRHASFCCMHVYFYFPPFFYKLL